MYSGYGITFDSEGSKGFDNVYTRNVLIFGVANSSSSHSVNQKSNLLVRGGCPAFGINGSFGSTENQFSINVSEKNTKFCLHFQYNTDNSYLFC